MLFPNLISNLNGYQHAFGIEGALHSLNKDVNFKMETYQLKENYNNHTVFPQGRLRIKKKKRLPAEPPPSMTSHSLSVGLTAHSIY